MTADGAIRLYALIFGLFVLTLAFLVIRWLLMLMDWQFVLSGLVIVWASSWSLHRAW